MHNQGWESLDHSIKILKMRAISCWVRLSGTSITREPTFRTGYWEGQDIYWEVCPVLQCRREGSTGTKPVRSVWSGPSFSYTDAHKGRGHLGRVYSEGINGESHAKRYYSRTKVISAKTSGGRSYLIASQKSYLWVMTGLCPIYYETVTFLHALYLNSSHIRESRSWMVVKISL